MLCGCALAAGISISAVFSAYACTGVIVGKDLTEDGSTIFGRTEDLEVNHNKAYKIHEAGNTRPERPLRMFLLIRKMVIPIPLPMIPIAIPR